MLVWHRRVHAEHVVDALEGSVQLPQIRFRGRYVARAAGFIEVGAICEIFLTRFSMCFL
jgi:hypothetical protein